MELEFDIPSIKETEFGVGRDLGVGRDRRNVRDYETSEVFNVVPIDDGVKDYLHEMITATIDSFEKFTDEPSEYSASERYESQEYLWLPLDNDVAMLYRNLHEAINLDEGELTDTADVFCYFAQFTDSNDKRLTALHRPTQFKSLRKKIVKYSDDTLQILKEPVFKLDQDFDILIDSKMIHILRPSSFEFMGKLQKAIIGAVSGNISKIRNDMQFVDFQNIEAYALEHPRAARYIASIQTNNWAKGIDYNALRQLCAATGVSVTESDGQLTVPDDHVLGFLEVVDRRRYEIMIVKDSSEQFKAAKRQKL